jgi:hypothetical protein
MRKRMMSTFGVLGLLVVLSSPSPAAGNHPEIQDALAALEKAKAHLQQANHDFGGHRDNAISAINGAEKELRICLKY